MLLKKKIKLHSLRTRYISLALFLGFTMLAGAGIGYRTMLIDTHASHEQLDRVTQQAEHLEHIKELMHTTYRSLTLFLLDPQQTEQRTMVHLGFVKSISHIEEMTAVDSAIRSPINDQLALLKEKIERIMVEAERLFDIRIDPLRQYPPMKIARRITEPARLAMTSALDAAIAEAKLTISESGAANYIAFVELQHNLDKMRLALRLFMLNRNSGFNSPGAAQQADNAVDIYDLILSQITQIKERDRQGLVDFDGSNAIDVIKTKLPKWMAGFSAIQTIGRTGNWQLDTQIMRQNILPISTEIAKILHTISETIQHKNKQIEASHDQIKTMQNQLLAALIVIIVIYIIIMLLSLERMIFQPIAAVAQALKAKTFGETQELLLHTRTKETQDLIGAFYEMNLQVHNRQMALEHQALHDALTSLPNRNLLRDRVDYQLAVSKREKQSLSLCIIDLNRFKEVNDTLGHHIGDQLLIGVGQRLKACLRGVDTIARLGGDEFAILLPHTTRQQSETVAKKLLDQLKEPFVIDENQLYVGISIGIATYAIDGDDRDTLMRHADVAMYNAKANHLGYANYNIDDDPHSIDRLALVQDLRHAISHDELALYFQPKIDLEQNKPTGAEALLRWQHPKLGFIAPDQIVELAEDVGLIDELTAWVISRAIAQCSACHADGFPIDISINLSVKNLLDNQLPEKISTLLKKHQFDSSFVTLEVTESSMMSNLESSIKVLNELSEIGVAISVDDFGTGFSSLAYLKQLPVNELKIDKSFVMEMAHNESDAVIVHSTIDLGHNLGLKVVAEGIENQQTYDIIKRYGCDLAQGYLFTRPLPIDEFKAWLIADRA